MLWDITIIVGIKLFLRADEVLDMIYDQFLVKYFVVKETHVDSLLVIIKGKKDNFPVHFALWDDHDCPDFSSACPALLLWLSFSGIRGGGYLFLSLEKNGKDYNPDKNYG